MEIILVSPDIPQNVGNIARTCAATGARLTLVRPLGFNLSSKHMKRAGLDYWEHLDFRVVNELDWEAAPTYFFSTKAKRLYTDVDYEPNCRLVFGSESEGLPQPLHDTYGDQFVTIPMLDDRRSLNLSNSVAIGVYNVIRVHGFQLAETP